MKRIALFVFALLSLAALAQVTAIGSSGRTTGPLTFYVNIDGGSDFTGCGSAKRPCASLQMAWDKIPHEVYHDVTINIAPGTYMTDAGTTLANRYINTGVTVSITGDWTSDGGGSIGDAGVYAANTFPTKPSLTDTRQSWTASQYQGMYVSAIAADGGVSVYTPIVDNTSTALTLVATNSALSTGVRYNISYPAVTLASREGHVLRLASLAGLGSLNISAITLQPGPPAAGSYTQAFLASGVTLGGDYGSGPLGTSRGGTTLNNVTYRSVGQYGYFIRITASQNITLSRSVGLADTASSSYGGFGGISGSTNISFTTFFAKHGTGWGMINNKSSVTFNGYYGVQNSLNGSGGGPSCYDYCNFFTYTYVCSNGTSQWGLVLFGNANASVQNAQIVGCAVGLYSQSGVMAVQRSSVSFSGVSTELSTGSVTSTLAAADGGMQGNLGGTIWAY